MTIDNLIMIYLIGALLVGPSIWALDKYGYLGQMAIPEEHRFSAMLLLLSIWPVFLVALILSIRITIRTPGDWF